MHPKEVAEAIFGLRTMVTEVNTSIQVVFSTHHLVTLHDLERLVLTTNKTFESVSKFDDLMLGSLRTHPAVRSKFAEGALVGTPPRVSSQAVLEHIASALEKKWEGRGASADRLDMDEILGGLAIEHGVSAPALGVFIRSKGFLIGLVARLVGARTRVEVAAEKSAKRKLEQA